ncbi:MAG: hypothetical protein JSU92_05250 [Deltaproteobacteria bacterium]|nr:MAG: hypothetical protein JSU92_05250 [Deltaproteobacteria bacterium]
MSIRTPKAIYLIIAGVICACTPAPLLREGTFIEGINDREGLLNSALRAQKMSRQDLSFKKDYVEKDPFRLNIVDTLLSEPLKSISVSERWLNELSQLYDSGPETGVPADASGASLTELLRFTVRELESGVGESESPRPYSRKWKGLPTELRKPLNTLISALKKANLMLNESLAMLSRKEIEFLKENVPLLITDDEDELEEEKYEEVLDLAGKVDWNKLFASGRIMAAGVDSVLPELMNMTFERKGVVFETETPWGKVIVGGVGDNTYHRGAALIIDLGGDDRYFEERREGTPISVILDLKGNDLYHGSDSYCQGTGFFGVGILVDIAGDDQYLAKDFSQGCGILGIGLLLDRAGEDQYSGDSVLQGAGIFGIGILEDREGNDHYQAGRFAQGFGFTRGFGLLLDGGGTDLYYSGGRYTDFREKRQYYQSLSQGFGYGLRPTASGGIGLLADLKGNDTYIADYFSQGSSYWYALGVLLDKEGNDKYLARRYSQGAGTHLTVGILMDAMGDDIYRSWGVSQACGHDLAVGILIDKEGDDQYSADLLSQGVGHANGLGIMMDYSGKDSYLSRQDRILGYGATSRDFGSIGIFLDGGGKDIYLGKGKDDSIWTQKNYGVGIDGFSDSQ